MCVGSVQNVGKFANRAFIHTSCHLLTPYPWGFGDGLRHQFIPSGVFKWDTPVNRRLWGTAFTPSVIHIRLGDIHIDENLLNLCSSLLKPQNSPNYCSSADTHPFSPSPRLTVVKGFSCTACHCAAIMCVCVKQVHIAYLTFFAKMFFFSSII